MPISEARKRANAKYNAKAYDRLELKVIKGNKEIIQGYCKDKNTSVNGLMNDLLQKRLAADGYEMIAEHPNRKKIVNAQIAEPPKQEPPIAEVTISENTSQNANDEFAWIDEDDTTQIIRSIRQQNEYKQQPVKYYRLADSGFDKWIINLWNDAKAKQHTELLQYISRYGDSIKDDDIKYKLRALLAAGIIKETAGGYIETTDQSTD